MDAVTYPDKNVAAFIEIELVPIRILYDAVPMSQDFNVKWTPTLVVLDVGGKEHYRTLGFIPPEDLVASLLLGMGKACFDLDEWDQAIENFERIIKDYSKSYYAPEAVYLRGVSRYKATEQGEHLKQIYETLRTEYPQSVWTSRALPYRLL